MNGDCLELLKDIPDESIDMVLCDLPYGTTQCKWDSCIPLDKLWEEYNRVAKLNAAIVLFAQAPFSAQLMMSNIKHFRYEWVWVKKQGTGFLNANKMPLKAHENILVFYKKLPIYNPQMRKADLDGKPFKHRCKSTRKPYYCEVYDKLNVSPIAKALGDERTPIDVVKFSMPRIELGLHPTQKPVSLCEYLIKSYTNEGATVLDNCMGSGTAGVACVNTNRNFIGMELDPKYFTTAESRINEALAVVNNV